ncbi:HAD family hydrolase [Chryseomicrobium palamuruense]|uniref:Phosphoserine phosphatase n=1 Tax=Chryseomicrobium palamuruense TaxID=682973 RepID=A0ABV8UWN6_9BACL
MKTTVLFDLDDTLLWDAKSVEVALKKTCTLVAPNHTDALYKAIRNEAPKVYQTYSFYEFTQQIGINPFEGLWGSFPDEQFHFPSMGEQIREYQLQAWEHALIATELSPELAPKAASAFIEIRKAHPYLYEETLDVLEKVSQRYTIGIVTNGAPSLQNIKFDLSPELISFAKTIVISGEVGMGKPDALPFQEALRRLSAEPNEVCMVGDNLSTDIRGAEQLQIDTIWINHHEKVPPEDIHPTYEVKRLQDVLPILGL